LVTAMVGDGWMRLMAAEVRFMVAFSDCTARLAKVARQSKPPLPASHRDRKRRCAGTGKPGNMAGWPATAAPLSGHSRHLIRPSPDPGVT
jgi:hypothetical protein